MTTRDTGRCHMDIRSTSVLLLNCTCNDRKRTFVPRSEVMFRIFKAMFESLAVPYAVRSRDYRMTLQQVSTRTVDWL